MPNTMMASLGYIPLKSFWHAVNASQAQGITYAELDEAKSKSKVDLGYAGTVVEWRTEYGVLREEILKYGLHDVIMGNPIISLAVLRMFEVHAARS